MNTDKPKFRRDLARTVADGLIELLRPMCDDICVAGSLRRGKAEVWDVEILYVPKMGEIKKPGEMFSSMGSLADNYINGLVGSKLEKRLNVDGRTCWGLQNKLAVHKATGIPVDLFATNWDNWFVSLVIRTGPKEFNIVLIESAKKRGLQLHAYGAFTHIETGAPVYPKSELEVFQLAGLAWMAAEERENFK